MIKKLRMLDKILDERRNMMKKISLLIFTILLIPAIVHGQIQVQSFALNQIGNQNYVPVNWYENDVIGSIYKQKIDLNLKNVTLKEALDEIDTLEQLRLTYNSNQLPGDTFTFIARDIYIYDIFDELLASTDLEALASPTGQVVIKKKSQIFVQQTKEVSETVTGVVLDSSTGETLPGVNVVVEGTNIGTSTNVDGEFELTVSSLDETLVFSFVGFETIRVPLNQQSYIEIEMTPMALIGDEIVVVGYGDQRRQDLTGSISSVNSERLERSLSSTFDRAIQGRAPGVMVTQNTGRPGGNASIRIRGTNSLTGDSEPLYVIDGVPISGSTGTIGGTNVNASSPLAGINPNDIESIDILKDASATAIYGARASNGVVMITTKRGRAGETNVDYTGYVGFQQVPSRLDMMNLQEFAGFMNELISNGFAQDRVEFRDPSILGEGTNWQEELFKTTPMTNHTLAVSGGDDVTRYRLSAGYFGQDGVISGSHFDRFSARIALDNNPTNWLQIGSTLNLSQTEESLITDERQGEEIIISTALRMPPNVPIRNPDGSFGGPTGPDAAFGFNNPIAMAQLKDDELTRRSVTGNLYANVNLIESLSLRSEFNLNYGDRKRNYFLPRWQLGDISNDQNEGVRNRDSNFWWQSTTYLTYNQSLTNRLLVNATLGHEIEESNWEGVSASRRNFPADNIRELGAGDAETSQASSYSGSSSLQSLFTRMNLRFDERYLLTATFRADASSKFAPENRWGYFPSFSVAWRLSNESFFNVNAISELRLRAGYGIVGNQGIGDYLFGSVLNVTPTRWGVGVRPGNVPNPDLRWESTESVNLGLNISLFNDRVNLEADVYQKWTDDLLMTRPLPLFSGTSGTGSLGAPVVNIGALENKGLELALNTINMNRTLRWESTLIYSLNRNKVTRLDQDGTFLERNIQHFDPVSRTIVGHPVGQFYGYKTDGLFTTREEIENHAVQNDRGIDRWQGVWLGDVRFLDINDDRVIDENDRTVIGDPNPKFTFGITNDFFYRNFDLSVFINGSYGNDIFNQVRRWTEETTGGLSRSKSRDVLNFARVELIDPNGNPDNIDDVQLVNPNTNMQRINSGDPNNNMRISDRFVEDGSYLRLRNLTLGYTLPPQTLSRFNIREFRVYFSGQNLFTITNYSGHDPEVGSDTQDPLLFGVDIGQYPSQRILTLGVNFGF